MAYRKIDLILLFEKSFILCYFFSECPKSPRIVSLSFHCDNSIVSVPASIHLYEGDDMRNSLLCQTDERKLGNTGEKQDVRADPYVYFRAGSSFGLSLPFSRAGITPRTSATWRSRIFQVFLSPYRPWVARKYPRRPSLTASISCEDDILG